MADFSWILNVKKMLITYFGHSCLGVKIGKYTLLFDPFISENKLAAHININEVETDYIFLSHGHFDHVSDTLAIANRTNATLIANPEVNSWFKEQGVSLTIPMNIGGKIALPFGTVRMVAAAHSSTMPDGSNGGNAGGFLVHSGEKSFYFAGDTGLTTEMKLISEFWQVDFAILPIGDHFTMGIDEAIIAAKFVGVKKVIGVHYDTFPYITIKKDDAIYAFAQAGIELILLPIGGSIQL